MALTDVYSSFPAISYIVPCIHPITVSFSSIDHILSRLIQSCLVLSCLVLSCLVLQYSILQCRIFLRNPPEVV